MKSLVAGALLAIASLGPARAADTAAVMLSGDQLLSNCLSEDPGQVLFCSGSVAGVADALTISRAIDRGPPCIPDVATVAKVRDVAVRYLQQHPEYGGKTAANSVVNAIVAEWKCGKVGG